MKKLLLLSAIPLIAFLYSFAGTETTKSSAFVVVPYKDSSIKDEVINSKEGFKNLIETNSASYTSNIQLNPKAVSFVHDYKVRNTARLVKMKSWGRPYFDLMDGILKQHGLPVQLKYLTVIESQLKSSALSSAGAVGPWQFMAMTARGMGLKVTKTKDERKDYGKSTQAAAKYLSHLYGIYNDWLLVIAAYNGGPGAVNTAIRKSGSRNFWSLQQFLPAESRNHVKKFIATHYIMEGCGGLTTLTAAETKNLRMMQPSNETSPLPEGTGVLAISGKYSAAAIAECIDMNLAAFHKLNPGFDRELSAKGAYEMKLPADKMDDFQEAKSQILEQSVKMLLASTHR